MTFNLDNFGHGTLTMDSVRASGSRPLLTILVRYPGMPKLLHEPPLYEGLLFANLFASNPSGPIPYMRNVEDYYKAMSCGRFTWVNAGSVGPIDLTPAESDGNGLRERIVQIVKNRNLFDFTGYNVPGEARVAGKRDINAIIFSNKTVANQNPQSGNWISMLPGDSSLTEAAHELMHMIGTDLDIYGYTKVLNSKFSLMSNSASEDLDRRAFHADPWHKLRFGWEEPRIEEIRPLPNPIRLVAPGVRDPAGTCILHSPTRPESEYFILEFRNPTQAAALKDLASYDSGAGGAGLAIWHIVLQIIPPVPGVDNQVLKYQGRPMHLPGPNPTNPKLDWVGVYLDADPAGKFTRLPGQMYDGFQAGGLILWAGSTVTPALCWLDGSSTGVRIAVADFASDADVLDVRVFDETDNVDATRFWYSASSSQYLIVSSYGVSGNLELLLPVRGHLQHYWRTSEPGHVEWHGPISAAPLASPGADGRSQGLLTTRPLGVSLIQSNFGSPGNLEAIVRMSVGLTQQMVAHVVRSGGDWSSPAPILVNGQRIEGVTGDPAFIQSTFGTKGNFELLVLAGSRLLHFFRDNDASGYPWHGPAVVHDFSVPATQGRHQQVRMTPITVSLVQTNIGQPGQLEAVVLVEYGLGEMGLWGFKMGQSGWVSTGQIAVDKSPIKGVTGNPALLQSNYGQTGNLELVVPAGPRLLHYWRDNDAPSYPWHGPVVVFDGTGLQETYGPVALVQNGVRFNGDLEVLTVVTPPSGEHFLISLVRTTSGWRMNGRVSADGAPITGITAD